MAIKTEMDIETLLHWAYRDELSKKQLSAAEGIWDRIEEDGQRGGVDKGQGAAQRYAHFGLPDPDAEIVERAVAALSDMVINWEKSFKAIAGDLSALISINEMNRHPSMRPKQPRAGWGKAGSRAVEAFWGKGAARPIKDRPRDVLMVGGLRVNALVTMHAIRGSRPDWVERRPEPGPTPAIKGPNAMIVGECRGKNLYSTGSHCPVTWTPSPLSIVSNRAEYAAWHEGLCQLADTLQLSKFVALQPKACATPWLENDELESRLVPVMPTASNRASAWGTLPLKPYRERIGVAPARQKAGPVRVIHTASSNP